ncbi:Quinic acid utilization activator [Zalerion maritima]|uniref:Quinic acid utilization activator n=1 Tax=Zalerion maritima TaxID=339359 RepID=A0AAD5RVV3_9PEZI|nr:Quinic acid utilization activator [Zalerion maritima]
MEPQHQHHPNDQQESQHSQQQTENDIPSCQGCRRRKLRCSRDQPTCVHCSRLGSECVYDLRKNKPGLRPGAVESLNRRVEALEQALQQGRHDGPDGPDGAHSVERNSHPNFNSNPQIEQPILSVLSTLASELTKLNERVALSSGQGQADSSGSIQASPKHDGSTPSDEYQRPQLQRPPKRRRLDSCGNIQIEVDAQLEELRHSSTTLPSRALLDEILVAYFSYVQPWIPILHETSFRRRLQQVRYEDGGTTRGFTLLLHAIVVGALRLVGGQGTSMGHDAWGNVMSGVGTGMRDEDVAAQVEKSRNYVLLRAMSNLSVENLQALIIVAFTDIGNGQAAKAWSIIGSITRTVEFLSLNVEPEDRAVSTTMVSNSNSLVFHQGQKSECWVEQEQERRVFWNIFSLDRYCSVTRGWNTSLTAENVHRKLPADGGLWHKSEPVGTPFFGIWDRSVAKLGNSVAFLPAAHYPSPEQPQQVQGGHGMVDGIGVAATTVVGQGPETPNTAGSADKSITGAADTTIGAFAYCIEATESLSRVTTYFLQQPVNYKDRQEVSNWLTRFKELDIRLVHWKMFLPPRWSDSNVSRLPTVIEMDPNLTLAHITHNTSMILLHHRIAYPAPEWSNIIKLPSDCSAETCYVAAIETANITEKYLRHTHKDSPVNAQFAFCVFVSARLLLVHKQATKTPMPTEYFALLTGLEEMAQRWVGPSRHGQWENCLAGRYVLELRAIYQNLLDHPEQIIQVLPQMDINGNPIARGYSARNSPRQEGEGQDPRMAAAAPTPTTATMAMRGNPSSNQSKTTCPVVREGVWTPGSAAGRQQQNLDELSNIGQMLLDPQFLEMDRIISFDDVMFSRPEQLIPGAGGMADAANGMANGMELQGWVPGPA